MGIFQQFPYSNFHEMNLDQILKIMREMQDEWENTKSEWASYKDFIDNYFANLDVSQEVLEALRVTMADGTFNDTVDPVIIATITQWLNDNITPTTPAIDASLSVSGAGADAEVTGSYTRENNSAFNKFIESFDTQLSKGYFQHGVYNPGTGNTTMLMYRIGSRAAIHFDTPVVLTIAAGFRILPYVFDNNVWTQGGWTTGSYELVPTKQYQFQIARVTEDPDEVADFEEFFSAVTVTNTYAKIVLTDLSDSDVDIIEMAENNFIPIEMEQGGWGLNYGNPKREVNATRLRSKKIFKVCAGQTVVVSTLETIQFNITLISSLTNGSVLESSGWTAIDSTQTEHTYTFTQAGYAYVTCKRQDGTNISMSDYTTNTAYAYLTRSFPFNIPGRKRHIYQFGGNGNNWCFVYTPTDYDPKRKKPYPFVVCNHGNGWVMTGHASLANWTKHTMYVPTTDPDYINDPANFNGTTDKRLFYSNPTIELLRDNGYIVCGCENYGDLLFGNDNCRNACVDFVDHMVEHYNVEDRCYMIGASNGALTALNANYLLQGRVKAMILQYPLTCLFNQYKDNPAHKAQIDTAYGIPGGATDAQVKDYIKTHDPLTTDVVDNLKVGVVAPTKIWASPDDAVADIDENARPYTAMITPTKVCELVEVTGGHGNYTHFDPVAFLAWFETYK